MPSAKLSSKGRLVVPKEVRELLGIRAGDRVDFVLEEGGRVVIRPAVLDVRELRGLLARPDAREPVSIQELNRAVRDRLNRG